jgi:hypothetical protein
MTLDDYFKEWAKDAPVPADNLDESARQVPYLHAKWYRFWSTERLLYKKLDFEYKVLYNHKYQWYNGKMIDEDRKALGWPPNPLKLLPVAIPRHMDADADIQKMLKQKVLAEETCKFLEDVVKQINGRGYYIATAVNFLKFKCGV